jgi:signal transduction histidine kinase
MRRGPKPAKSKKAKPPSAPKSPKDDSARVRDLEKRLAEALEQQRASGDILRVISSSPTNLQPVLDAIATNAALVCDAYDAVVFLREGDRVRYAAHYGPITITLQRSTLSRGSVTEAAILDRQPVHVHDVLATEPPLFPLSAEAARKGGFRTALSVPLLRENEAIGALAIRHREVRPFTTQQIDLLKTFADQAVIAIENVRLFNETKEALERQMATSEILRVISQSPTDLTPVARAIAENAARLCETTYTAVFRFDGELIHWVAAKGASAAQEEALRTLWPRPATRERLVGRTILAGTTLHIEDVAADPTYTAMPAARTDLAIRTVLNVPMLRRGQPVGVIGLIRSEVKPFSAREISLVQMFANQAVIAIENVRLFNETKEALDRQTATADILRVISSSPIDVQPVFDAIAESAARLCSAHDAQVLRVEGDTLRLVAACGATTMPPVRQLTRGHMVGHAVIDGRTIHVRDRAQFLAEYPETTAVRYGTQSAVAVPLLRDGVALGVIRVSRTEMLPFTDSQIALLQTFANQAVIAIENVRLFTELEEANRELSAASQHKSEFLANMSHELRTPLNAIIGFSEVLSDRMFGELNEKQEEYLKDINASGGHLLSLINDILDLSKIEAGRMELELTEFDLPTAIENALTLVRERAGRRSIVLHTSIDERLGQIQADERKIRQVVLNLLSNAIKFTPEGGRIDVRAVPEDGFVAVSVSDTGIGIAPDDQEKVFEEFRQVGTAAKKVEGTGLGLTLCRKFVELHGGRIRVKSELGVGSMFTFSLPLQAVANDRGQGEDR